MRLTKQNVERIVSNPAEIAKLVAAGFKQVSDAPHIVGEHEETRSYGQEQPKKRRRRTAQAES